MRVFMLSGSTVALLARDSWNSLLMSIVLLFFKETSSFALSCCKRDCSSVLAMRSTKIVSISKGRVHWTFLMTPGNFVQDNLMIFDFSDLSESSF